MAVLPPDSLFSLRSNAMNTVNSLSFLNTDKLLAGTLEGVIHLWDLDTNRNILTFTNSTEPVMSMFNIDESLITQEKGGIIRKWSLINTGYEQINDLNLKNMSFCRMDVLPKENALISPINTNQLGIIDIERLEERCLLTHNIDEPTGPIMSLRYIEISGQPYVLAGYDSGHLITYDLKMNKAISAIKIDDCPMSIDYDMITNRGIFGGPSDKIGVFSYNKNTTEIIKKTEIPIKNAGIQCVKIRQDQKVFCTGGCDGRIRIFSWKSLRPLAVLTEHRSDIMDIAYSNGKVSLWRAPIMAVAGLDGQITLWDLYN